MGRENTPFQDRLQSRFSDQLRSADPFVPVESLSTTPSVVTVEDASKPRGRSTVRVCGIIDCTVPSKAFLRLIPGVFEPYHRPFGKSVNQLPAGKSIPRRFVPGKALLLFRTQISAKLPAQRSRREPPPIQRPPRAPFRKSDVRAYARLYCPSCLEPGCVSGRKQAQVGG